MDAHLAISAKYQLPNYLLKSLDVKQFQAANWLAQEERGIAWWSVGEGKTRIALAWCFYSVPRPRPLVICSPGAFRQWEDEIYKLKLEKVIKPRFMSYGMLSRKDRHLVVPFEKVNCLILDELWLYKNYKSKRSLMLRDITKRLPTIGLSGSMITARNIEDLYGQACAVGVGTKIAPNITGFRKDFCIEIFNHRFGFIERYPKKNAVEMIQKRIAKHIHVHFPLSTRNIRNIPVNVSPTLEQAKIRNELVKTYYYEHQSKYGFKLEINSAVALLIKLQQLSDGFLRNAEGDHLPIKSNKMLRLKELCKELIDGGERILVWCAFRHTTEILRNALPFKVQILSSQHKFDPIAWRKEEARICIATVGSGASLNDFANIRYAIFYSTRFSHLQVQQAKGRTLRKSDAGSRYFYYMQTERFPDKDVYEMIEQSRSTEEATIMIMNALMVDALAIGE